jgi:hypothetical protein
MTRVTWIRIVEMVTLLPATLVLMPIAAFASLGMLFVIAQDVFKNSFRYSTDAGLIEALFWLVGGVFGIIAVWLAVALPYEAIVGSAALRIGISSGILVGIADAVHLLWTMARDQGVALTIGRTGWAVWALMLAGPLCTGIHQVFRLMANRTLAAVPVEPMNG